ncbi:MAG: hypothetical protein ACYTGZ_07510, partial [Planctomycetota bacterium]
MTRAPRASRPRAISLPMPWLAPVTSAVRPDRSFELLEPVAELLVGVARLFQGFLEQADLHGGRRAGRDLVDRLLRLGAD